jgi:hypothetical protein
MSFFCGKSAKLWFFSPGFSMIVSDTAPLNCQFLDLRLVGNIANQPSFRFSLNNFLTAIGSSSSSGVNVVTSKVPFFCQYPD